MSSHFMCSDHFWSAKKWLCSLFSIDWELLPNLFSIIDLLFRKALFWFPLILLDIFVYWICEFIEVELIKVNCVLAQNCLLNSLILVTRLVSESVLCFLIVCFCSQEVLSKGVILFIQSWLQTWVVVLKFGKRCTVLWWKICSHIYISFLWFFTILNIWRVS